MSTVDGNLIDAGTTGLIVLQAFFEYLCQGVIFTQAVKFFKRSEEDTIYLRTYVIVLVLLGCLETAISSYKVWVVAVFQRHWWTSNLYNTNFFINALICTTCEVYLIRRCWKMTKKNIWVLAILSALAIIALIGNISLEVEARMSLGMPPQYLDPLRTGCWSFPVWVYASLALEIALTTTLSVALWRSKTGYSYLDKALRNIIGITWESAALPCMCMIVAATLYFVGEKSYNARHWDLFFVLCTAKFYMIGLLRTLNSRVKLREKITSGDVCRKSLGTWLSGETTVCEREDNSGNTNIEHSEAFHENTGPESTQARSELHSSPELDSREKGVVTLTTRKVGFEMVN
ncbi:hypothetical protein C8Q75DRAFT_221125 [Abortiporus biennis]|nr:hypothetical protein C8Q75DRAFT_221125 [Abortiporus biennis]